MQLTNCKRVQRVEQARDGGPGGEDVRTCGEGGGRVRRVLQWCCDRGHSRGNIRERQGAHCAARGTEHMDTLQRVATSHILMRAGARVRVLSLACHLMTRVASL